MCKMCGEWDWVRSHECQPRWRVDVLNHHDPDEEGDGLDVYAGDAGLAAQKAVEEWDDERIVLNGSVEVMVRPYGNPKAPAEWFEVTAEAVVEYTAHAKEAADG